MGILFITMYVVFVGLATLFLKFSLDKHLENYKLLMFSGISMFIVGLVATLIANRGLSITKADLSAGLIYGGLHAIGALGFFIAASKMDIGIATALAMVYVVVAAVGSWLFLDESMNSAKVIGIVLILAGAAVLALQRG